MDLGVAAEDDHQIADHGGLALVVQRHDLGWSKNSNLPIFNDLQGDEEIAHRPLARLSLFDELEPNAGDHLRFG